MLRSDTSKRLWIETETGEFEPVESHAQIHSRKRGPGVPDWWVVAKDPGWRPPRKNAGGGCVSKPNFGGELQACTPDGRYAFDRGNGSGGPGLPPPPAQDKETRLVWSQGRGALETVEGVFLGQGYSGVGGPNEKGVGRNNPSREGEKDVGPIPQGNWRIERITDDSYRRDLTRPIFRLVPLDDGTRERVQAMGRDPNTFLVHGNNDEDNASSGCIILDKPKREKLAVYNTAVIHVGK